MAKPVQKTRRKAEPKAIAAVTLVVALILTLAAGYLGLSGMKLDGQGLYKLLAWMPTPSQTGDWRQALVPGADFGNTMVQDYDAAPLTEAESVSPAQLEKAAQVLARRLAYGGWPDAQVEVLENNRLRLTLPDDGTHGHAYEMLAAPGDIGFAGPDGEVFLTSKNIKSATYGANPQDGSYTIGFVLDGEGKKLFAEKTTQLVGQSLSLMVDGVAVASPGINEPLVDGQASLPGFGGENAVAYATMMQTEPLPLRLNMSSESSGAPLLGENAQNGVILALYAAALLLAVAFVVRYRLGGLIALWTIVIQLLAMFFFAGLMRAGFTVSTMLAVYTSLGLLVFALIVIWRRTRQDVQRGRGIKQAIRDAYASAGKVAADVLVLLLAVAVVLIIADSRAIGQFMRVLGIGVLLDLVLVMLVHRVLLNSAVTLFGSATGLYTTVTVQKEAE